MWTVTEVSNFHELAKVIYKIFALFFQIKNITGYLLIYFCIAGWLTYWNFGCRAFSQEIEVEITEATIYLIFF